jgi:hypothetical protein
MTQAEVDAAMEHIENTRRQRDVHNREVLESLGRDIEAVVKTYDEWQQTASRLTRYGQPDDTYAHIAKRNFEESLDKLRDLDLKAHL